MPLNRHFLKIIAFTIPFTPPAIGAPVVPKVECQASATTMRVVALERKARGQLTLKVEYQSDANIKQKIVPMKFFATDDAGHQYGPPARLAETQLSPQSKTNAAYQLVAPTGGAEGAFANLAIKFRVYGEKFKPRDCDFAITGVPISDTSQ